MYKNNKFTKETRDIIFKNIMGFLSYDKWLNRKSFKNDIILQQCFISQAERTASRNVTLIIII